jgi:hypothetical protein
MPAPGLSRAAMMAFAAASLGAAACGGETEPGRGNQQIRDGATDGANMTGTGGAANTGGMFVTFYGAPFPPTGGSPNVGDGGRANTAGTAGAMAMPLYGASPAPQKKP